MPRVCVGRVSQVYRWCVLIESESHRTLAKRFLPCASVAEDDYVLYIEWKHRSWATTAAPSRLLPGLCVARARDVYVFCAICYVAIRFLV